MSRHRAMPGHDVQWAQTFTVREGKPVAVGKVHVMGEDGRTLCGRQPHMRCAWRPDERDVREHGRCKHCDRERGMRTFRSPS